MREGLGISPLRQILKELADESKVIALPEKTGVGGRPKLLYRAISERAVRSSLARADIEPEAIRDEQPTLYRQILEQSLGRYANVHPEERRRLFAETARRLRQENPAELFLRFARWLKERYEEELESMRKCINQGKKKDAQRHQEMLALMEDVSTRIFDRLLGVPRRIVIDRLRCCEVG